MVDPLLCCLVLLVYSLPLLVVHLAPMADAYSVLRPGAWWRKTGESDTPHGWPEAVERRVRASAARRSVATTLPDGYATASASPKAAPTNDLESPDGSVHDLTRARAAAHGGWEALYGPDTRPPAYHEARARAERLALDDVAEDYPMEASAEQQAPVLYRCGCADCPGLPWSPSGSQPHPCGRAAPDEPGLLGEAQVLAEQPEHAHLAALRLRAARLGSVGILTATERAEVDALRWATSVLESARPEAPLQGGRDGASEWSEWEIDEDGTPSCEAERGPFTLYVYAPPDGGHSFRVEPNDDDVPSLETVDVAPMLGEDAAKRWAEKIADVLARTAAPERARAHASS